jgi:hypothetical protein
LINNLIIRIDSKEKRKILLIVLLKFDEKNEKFNEKFESFFKRFIFLDNDLLKLLDVSKFNDKSFLNKLI